MVNTDSGPCQVYMYSEWQVVQYIRDLINLSPLLERGFEEELSKFTKKLKQVGWGDHQIHQFITKACYGTRYEKMEDVFGDRIVPRPLPEAGDRFEYLRNKSRLKK